MRSIPMAGSAMTPALPRVDPEAAEPRRRQDEATLPVGHRLQVLGALVVQSSIPIARAQVDPSSDQDRPARPELGNGALDRHPVDASLKSLERDASSIGRPRGQAADHDCPTWQQLRFW